MKLIVGLGNPGQRYERTRHNAGFMAVDLLASRHAMGESAKGKFGAAIIETRIAGDRVALLKPTTFMNLSGRSVVEAVAFYKLDPETDLLVLVDDTALPVGSIRVRASGGSGGHNGLSDIDNRLGGAAYPRVRIGVGTKPSMVDQADWVLSRFDASEMPLVESSLAQAADAAELTVREGVTSAMNRFNSKVSASESLDAWPSPAKPPASKDSVSDDNASTKNDAG